MGRTGWQWVVALVACSCAGLSTVQTPDPLGPGQFEVGVEPSVVYWPNGAKDTNHLGNFNLSTRVGVSRRVTLGLRLGVPTLEVQTNILLSEVDERTLRIAIAPSLGVGALAAASPVGPGVAAGLGVTLMLSVPLLIGVRVHPRVQFIFGPKLHNLLGGLGGLGVIVVPQPVPVAAATFGELFSVGGSVGIAVRVSRYFLVLPEVSALWPVLRAGPALTALSDSSHSVFGGPAWLPMGVQFTVGFVFGTAHQS